MEDFSFGMPNQYVNEFNLQKLTDEKHDAESRDFESINVQLDGNAGLTIATAPVSRP